MRTTKRTMLLLIVLIAVNDLSAQNNQWKWISGDQYIPLYGAYGTQSVSDAANQPGARNLAATWKDASNNIWIFGGTGYGTYGSGNLNDLWKYTAATGQWTWMGGSSTLSAPAVYGTIGVADAANIPSGRSASATWIDASGNLWLFGGQTSGTIFLSDLWKYSPAAGQWTWMGGNTTTNQPGVYGTKGTADGNNKPGGRSLAAAWADASGNLWMFGGNGYASGTSTSGLNNDLWKYNIAAGQWTWVAGANSLNGAATYGTKATGATTNIPGGRMNMASWKDASGNFWLFGGTGYVTTSSGYLNDWWKYEPSTGKWTYVAGDMTLNSAGTYGTKGTGATTNKLGGRNGVRAAVDGSGNVWLYGGNGYGGSTSFTGSLRDLWKYSPADGKFAFIAGDNGTNTGGVYGTQGTAASTNLPGARYNHIMWSDASGNLMMLGGFGVMISGTTQTSLSDLWKFTTSSSLWTWVGGNKTAAIIGNYNARGVSNTTVKPGGRTAPASWTDASGDLWLFGGNGPGPNTSAGNMNDVWKFTRATGQWTWVFGDSTTAPLAVFGTKGTASSTNKPGGKQGAARWIDKSGNFWVFGGLGNGTTASGGYMNDLWKFNPSTNQWTFIAGETTINQMGVYGTQGVADAANKPGCRSFPSCWTDNDGNFWLFGGYGPANTSSNGYLSDLWKFDPSTGLWTWMKGPNTNFSKGVYGTPGTPDDANMPGGRQLGVSWTGKDGSLWLYGGYGSGFPAGNGTGRDLWKYTISTNQWTYIMGDTLTKDKPGVYGVKGTPDATSNPGSRQQPVNWTDTAGNLWLFGGSGYDPVTSSLGNMNDWWSYSPATNSWTWMSGSSSVAQLGTYGTQGTADAANTPGARYGATTWATGDGAFYMMGGIGYAASGSDYLNDMWSIQPMAPTVTPLPVKLQSFSGKWQNDHTVQLSWRSTMEHNSRDYVIERSATGDRYVQIGTIDATGSPNLYTFSDDAPMTRNFYRLKMVDLDGQSQYSGIIVLSVAGKAQACRLINNPVRNVIQLEVSVPASATLQLQIVTQSGRIALSGSRSIGAGTSSVSLPADQLTAGYYIVKVTGAGIDKAIPFIIVR